MVPSRVEVSKQVERGGNLCHLSWYLSLLARETGVATDVNVESAPKILGRQLAHDCAVDADYLSAPVSSSAGMHACARISRVSLAEVT